MNTISRENKILKNLQQKNYTGWLIALFSLLISSAAFGQINVSLEMDRKLYLPHEPVSGVLTIVNQAGRDLVFGESNGLSWLDFTVTNNRGHLIVPVKHIRHAESLVISAGQTYEKKVTINQYYPMAQIGAYHVKAMVNFPQINRDFPTKSIQVQISDGQALWSQIVGVPQGHPKAGSYREYSLMTFYHGSRGKALYFRLKDNDSGRVFKTYTLGNYLAVKKPVHHIDRENRLHVLHMSSPQKYSHSVISIDGDLLSRKKYISKGTDRPELIRSDYGEVTVKGGLTEEEATAATYEHEQFRMLSERPPGLPVVN